GRVVENQPAADIGGVVREGAAGDVGGPLLSHVDAAGAVGGGVGVDPTIVQVKCARGSGKNVNGPVVEHIPAGGLVARHGDGDRPGQGEDAAGAVAADRQGRQARPLYIHACGDVQARSAERDRAADGKLNLVAGTEEVCRRIDLCSLTGSE